MLQRFRDWLDKHGPFDLTLDGANLAFWGENYAEGGFKSWKVRVAYDHMQQLYPQAKILVVSAVCCVRRVMSLWGLRMVDAASRCSSCAPKPRL
jgi:hypothetical protein